MSNRHRCIWEKLRKNILVDFNISIDSYQKQMSFKFLISDHTVTIVTIKIHISKLTKIRESSSEYFQKCHLLTQMWGTKTFSMFLRIILLVLPVFMSHWCFTGMQLYRYGSNFPRRLISWANLLFATTFNYTTVPKLWINERAARQLLREVEVSYRFWSKLALFITMQQYSEWKLVCWI